MARASLSLTTPIDEIPGVQPRTAEGLAALGLRNLGLLVAHLPARHERVEAEATIAQLAPDQLVATRGTVTSTRVVRVRSPRFEAVLHDGSARLDVVWHNGVYLHGRIRPGARLRVQGKTRRLRGGLMMANPAHTLLDADEPPAADAFLRPIYPAREGLTSATIERTIARVLGEALPLIHDHLPADYRRRRELPELAQAYRMMHRPSSEADVADARRRLAFDELLLLQLGVHMKRAHRRRQLRAIPIPWSEALDRHIRERFPFPLTAAQDRVVREIARDLALATPANRLIQGDVGSGKTAVALYAMLAAVAAGHQAALVAPTELLAEQHLASIDAMLRGSRVRTALLAASLPAAERESVQRRARDGGLDILVGTHALLTSHVEFRSLAVAVVDEQHRFGVHQRAALRSKGPAGDVSPHVLVMTATPIPRTLAITIFGDLDISVLDELPPGRGRIETRVVGPDKRAAVYDYVRSRLDRGEQAYIVAPTIDAGPTGELGNLRALIARLEKGELAGKRLAALHGRLKRTTREAIMERFRSDRPESRIDALVATTIVEVGVDVPNATMMIVEGADRFGLAQLHQLRGRVGRGGRASVCVLIADSATEEAQARLDAVAATRDGFALAQRDFELRGPGELFGVRQSGMPPFKVADLSRDLPLLSMARTDAAEWIERSPALDKPDEALLRRRLMKAHGKWLGLGDVG